MYDNAKIINGELFKRLLVSGSNNLQTNVRIINNLNVFPIPDGDTGDNMFLTLKGGVDQIKTVNENTLSAEAIALANGMLLNARGNSGVILSQLFFGLSEGLENLTNATLTEFALAMEQGVKRAYSAVAQPVEGTILTVARESIEYSRKKITEDTTAKEFFEDVLFEMKKSLEKTPELLAVLKESGVIDSGGAGLVCIMEGFLKAFDDQLAFEEVAFTSNETSSQEIDFSKFNQDSVMEYGYCTEMLVQLLSSKTDVSNFSVDELVNFLNTIGDSIVAVKVGSIVKLHVHTLKPYMVLEYCQRFGEFLKVKIENMTLQHNESVANKKEEQSSTIAELNKKVKRTRKDFAVITVANGDGIIDMFTELGADYVVRGGQTNNPSAEDFIHAFEEVNANTILVLPNNSNIILAAKQAGEMYKDSDVRIVPSTSLGQGYSALSMIDLGLGDVDAIVESITESMQNTITGMVSPAVRTTMCNGVQVTEGDYMGFSNKEMIVSTPSKIQTVCELSKTLLTEDKSFIIALYGKNATEEERLAFSSFVSENLPSAELYEIDGKQDVYDFILIVE
jgi:DAK2 domain fusion protein YloV